MNRGTYAPMCAADMPWRWTVEQVRLDGADRLVLRRGPYLIGDYPHARSLLHALPDDCQPADLHLITR